MQQPKRIKQLVSENVIAKKVFFAENEKKGKFKLKVFFKDGNERTFYSKDVYRVWNAETKSHSFTESESYGLQRLQNLIQSYVGKFITALIYTNDEKNKLIEHWAGRTLKKRIAVTFTNH